MEEREKMAYVAGLIDGDGSISLCKKHDVGARSPLYFPMIQFSKANSILPSFLKDSFGGSLIVVNRIAQENGVGFEKKKLEYRWKLEKSNLCYPFLTGITEYLHNKHDQAQQLISFIEENPFVRGKKLTDEDLIYREKIYTKIKSLNASRDMSSRLKVTKKKFSNELFWPYLAGLLDTDGSFSIKKEKSGTYSPCILLSLVNARAINFIERNCKYGSIFLVKALKLKQQFYYRFGVYTKEDVSSVIKNILPYLMYKKNAAEILLSFCEGYVAQCGRYKKTEEQTNFREMMYRKLINVNNGVYKSSLIDLELLAGKAEDNKAQAVKACSVNVASEKTSKEDAVL